MNELIAKTEAFVRAHVAAHFPATLTYHTIDHMAEVAQGAKELAKHADLGKPENIALRIAAWFHDAAYYQGAENHEARSAQLAADFLVGEKVDATTIEQVFALILATRIDAPANNALEALIKDADIVHIARPDHLEKSERLRQEIEATQGIRHKKKEWLIENIAFLERTTFLSEAARALWDEGRERNLAAMRAMLQERDLKKQDERREDDEKQAEKDVLKKKKETERGVETMFKVTMGSHTRLSAIADRKANMMLSVSSLIIGVVLSHVLIKLDTNSSLLFPAGMLTLTCVTTIITATLATRPKVTKGNSSREEILKRNANLLFFGNFHNMTFPDFHWGIQQVMNDRDFLYGSMTRDLYFLGRVLHRKYRYLNLTYNIFAVGIVLSVAAGVYAAFTMQAPVGR